MFAPGSDASFKTVPDAEAAALDSSGYAFLAIGLPSITAYATLGALVATLDLRLGPGLLGL